MSTPTRAIKPPTTNLELLGFPKTTIYTPALHQRFRDMCREKYETMEWIFTDGSKTVAGVGAAAIRRKKIRSEAMPKKASVNTAEVYAVFLARNNHKRISK